MTFTAPRQGLPLCVDLDGTLIHTDLLFEAFMLLVRIDFLAALQAPLRLLRDGKAATKLRIAGRVAIKAELLPYCEPVLTYLRAEHSAGRPLVLVTAIAQPHAKAVAAHFGLFAGVLGTRTAETNLSSTSKARLLPERFPSGFEYIGYSRDDISVWQQATVVSVTSAPCGVRSAAEAIGRLGVHTERSALALLAVLKAIRLRQGLKSLLLFLPALAARRSVLNRDH